MDSVAPTMITVKPERKTGIDLLKLLSVIFIPLLHFCSYYFVDETSQVKFFFMHLIRWIAFAGVGMFMTISGYLYAKKDFNKKYFLNILKFLFTFLIFCIFTTASLHEGNMSWSSIRFYFLGFEGYFWFVNYWISMLFFIPFINRAMQGLSKSQYLLLLGSLIFFISLPSAAVQMNDIWQFKLSLPDYWPAQIFPIIFTVLGAGFSKFNFKVNKLVLLGLFIGAPVLNTILDIMYCKKYLSPFGLHLYVFNTYSNPLSILLIFALFGLLYDLKLPKTFAKVSKYISSISFEMYLALMVTDRVAGKVLERITINSYILKGLAWVITEFVVSFTIAVVFHYLIMLIIAGVKRIWRRIPFDTLLDE